MYEDDQDNQPYEIPNFAGGCLNYLKNKRPKPGEETDESRKQMKPSDKIIHDLFAQEE